MDGLQIDTVLAQGLATVQGLPYLFTGLSNEESVAYKSPSFLDLAKYSGYKIFVYDNNRASGEGDFFGRVLRRSTDVYRKIGNGQPDDILTNSIQEALSDPAPLKLIVLHTFGSHEPVGDRYPSEDMKFQDLYDNTIYYTSKLLAKWIELIDESNSNPSLLLYTSDHGLVLPPCSLDYQHGKSLSVLEVPFLMWKNRAARNIFGDDFDVNKKHSTAIIFEEIVKATGYQKINNIQNWPSSTNPKFQNHSWSELAKMNACTLN